MGSHEELCANSALVQEGNNDTAARIDSYVTFTTVYFSVGVVVDVLCVALFYVCKRRFERTRLRPMSLVVMAAFGSLVQMFYGCLQTITHGNYPCFLTVIFPIMIVPMVGTSVIGKLLLLLYLTKFAETSIRDKNTLRRDTNLSMALTASDSAKVTFWSAASTAFRVLFKKEQGEQNAQKLESDLYQLRFLKSRQGILAVTLVFLLPFLTFALIMLGTNPVFVYCINCAISGSMIVAIVVVTLITLGVGVVIWFQTRKLQDVWGLRNEAFLSIAACGIALLGFLLAQFHNRRVFETYSHQIIMSFGLWLVVIEQTVVQLLLALRSESKLALSRNKNEKTIESSGSPRTETVDSILQDKVRSKRFESHLAEEFGLESLLFLRDAEKWRESFFDNVESTRIARARHLNRTYIKSDGLYAINVSASATSAIAEVLNSSHPNVQITLFDEAVDEVRKLLTVGALQRFLAKDTSPSTASEDSINGRSPNALLLT